MKLSAFRRHTLAIMVAVALAGCGSQPPIGAPGVMPQASAHTSSTSSKNYRVLYSFGATASDGSNPWASLIDVGGMLYGTTYDGGSSSSCSKGCGTVFGITTGGTENVLYSFGAPPDGEYPRARLLNAGGTLYGTTEGGGANNNCGYTSYFYACGAVFSVTLAGSEKVVYSFRNGTDGNTPHAGLVDAEGTFYGTTVNGGLVDCGLSISLTCGTVFSITPSGTENVVYRFRGGRAGGGWTPLASLIDARGTFYGTTINGGFYHGGVVFSLTTSGTEKALHSFGNGRHAKRSDGYFPVAGLIDVKGAFYGTTEQGGIYNCGSGTYGCGTVFSITPDGTEKVLHSFGLALDGAEPTASLINVKGTLYGTTSAGGAHVCASNDATCGTVFSITPDGKEKVLHNFAGGTDGANPYAGLIDVNGTLYGTTTYGGAYGDGTVFALTP